MSCADSSLYHFLFFLHNSPAKSPTEPEFKNPREYTWTATKLAYPGDGQTRMYSVWGSSPTNVYGCGFSLFSGNQGAIYRYDGKQWTPVISLPSPDYNYFWEMTGFGENDIWVVGSRLFPNPSLDSAVVLHFNGTRWTQMLPSHMGAQRLTSIWGNSSQNLYFGSRDGKTIRYNGSEFIIDTVYSGLWIASIGGDQSQVFVMGNTYKGTLDDSVMCFMRISNAWRVVDTQLLTQHSFAPRFGSINIYSPTQDIYFSCGYAGIFRWEAGQWLKIFSPNASLSRMAGSSPTNVLAVGLRDRPVIYHWDGADWDEIVLPEGLIPNDVGLYDVWTDGRQAFIVGNNGGVSYVLHGK